MTLFLLVLAIACVEPFAAVLVETPRLGVLGSVVGFAFATAAAVGQFVGHHKLLAAIVDNGKCGKGWFAGALVVAYYATILLLGTCLALFTLFMASLVSSGA